ncbi:MAG: hypothetical protein K2X49_22980 [Acetobacteraceae bacterium]|nr:hypothetical protein [Acetobacteraceae bacterium]
MKTDATDGDLLLRNTEKFRRGKRHACCTLPIQEGDTEDARRPGSDREKLIAGAIAAVGPSGF